ncbi:DMT family transporter [Micromonospora sp. PLK6-60]|uniref:DMT family transporter n=1 Tax=Micromonospora sp. PLK6-60 TaxID=2873383 RepID=UPI001CA6DF92|nr:DMT family transporter [Micromonospora sp. PLK6-60]MBY8872035.1 DMT family transporter [Micromonospora sp. PLK6-60]
MPVPESGRNRNEVQNGEQARWAWDFLILSLVWGSSFALIKVAVNAGVPPMWVAFTRCLFGAAALGVISAVRRQPLPRRPIVWLHAFVVAALLNMAPSSLLAYGETQVSSVLAGILNAAVPLATVLGVVALVPQERLSPRRGLGILIGFVGVLTVVGVWDGLGRGTLAGTLACIASSVFLGAGFAYTRQFVSQRDTPAAAMAATQLLCATGGLAIVTPVVGGRPAWPGWGAMVALLVLGSIGTGVAYILNLKVIRATGPTVASTVTYVIPVWSIMLGAAFLAEPVTWHATLGAAVVLAGVTLTRMPPRRTDPPASATDDAAQDETTSAATRTGQ